MTQKRLTAVGLIASASFILAVAPANALTHRVRSGDTLWSLSKKYNISSEAIAKANKISLNKTLALGTSLVIPSSSAKPFASKSKITKTALLPGKKATVLKNAPLRSAPATSGKKSAIVAAGSQVGIIDYKWNWYLVKTTNGKTGWVGDYLVKVHNPAPLVVQAPERHITKKRVVSPSRSVSRTRAVRHDGRSSAYDYEQESDTTSSAADDAVVKTAYNYLGARYRYGGTSSRGFDCSGFTRYVYSKQGVKLPHSSSAQFNKGKPVSKGELKPGDLVFFSRGSRGIGHVGVYTGNGKFIHAANPSRGVRVDSLNSGSYAKKFKGARRVQ